jgi:hypothetical protein
MEVRCEFYNMFNRHYLNAPDTYIGDSTFGNVTGIAATNPAGGSGSRVGQLGARFQW